MLRRMSGGKQYKYQLIVPDVAANTWQALVVFIYTGTIRFAPLRSQGLEFYRTERTKHRETNPRWPALCSPKSVYRLADIVGLKELKILAFDDLKSRITEMTINREIFSKFTATYNEVLEMQMQILCTGAMLAQVMPKTLKTVAAVTQSSQMPHVENALAAMILKLSMILSTNESALPSSSSEGDKLVPLRQSPEQ
ncbi:hypothetical protein BDW22DRAFT_1360473 [Trametopsis cervina]|nr:hypothetical protein BDW22DRAFT_1360473 [Trametopsis cervina]